MNIKIANRLVELRKKNGLSQEQLADKLGLSRQAVSKWERAEASLDTDNLICLAKIYNVSLDELLQSDETVDDIARETKEKETQQKDKKEKESEIRQLKKGIYINDSDGERIIISGDGIHLKEKQSNDEDDDFYETNINFKDDKVYSHKKIQHIISSSLWSASFLIVIVAYIIIGFMVDNGWYLYWPLFFIAPIVPNIYDVIRKRRICDFIYPIFITGIYCFLGTFFNLWHPYWFLFITIPVFYACFSPIDKLIHKEF